MTLLPNLIPPLPGRSLPDDFLQPPARRPLRLVPPPRRRASGIDARLVWRAAGVAIFAGLFLVVGIRAVMASTQIDVDSLEAQVATRQAAVRSLRLEVSGLADPVRINSEAIGRLGMLRPESVVFLAP